MMGMKGRERKRLEPDIGKGGMLGSDSGRKNSKRGRELGCDRNREKGNEGIYELLSLSFLAEVKLK